MTTEIIVQQSPATGFSEMLVSLMQDDKIPAEKLQMLLQARRELLAEQRIESFNGDYVALHAAMPQVTKDGWVEMGVGKGRYPFARWEDVDTAIRPKLAEHNFALSFAEFVSPTGAPMIRAILLHRDGHSISAERIIIPDRGPGRNDAQAFGSGVSYAKRYLAEELCNIVRRGQDDDARSTELHKPITTQQVIDLQNLLDQTNTEEAGFIKTFTTVETVNQIPPSEYAVLMRMLAAKKKRQGEKL